MSLPLLFACLWVIIAAIVAFLPMRVQMIIGPVLLLAAGGLIGWIGVRHGIWIALLALLACLSMFRKPLFYYGRKLMTRGGDR